MNTVYVWMFLLIFLYFNICVKSLFLKMPTSDATIQCNLACMYVKIFTERDINFFRVVTAILLKREETVFFTDRVGPGHFIYVTQHSIFYLNFYCWRWFCGDQVRISSSSWQFLFLWMTYMYLIDLHLEKINQRYMYNVAWRSGKIFILFSRVSKSSTILSMAGTGHSSHNKLVI